DVAVRLRKLRPPEVRHILGRSFLRQRLHVRRHHSLGAMRFEETLAASVLRHPRFGSRKGDARVLLAELVGGVLDQMLSNPRSRPWQLLHLLADAKRTTPGERRVNSLRSPRSVPGVHRQFRAPT